MVVGFSVPVVVEAFGAVELDGGAWGSDDGFGF